MVAPPVQPMTDDDGEERKHVARGVLADDPVAAEAANEQAAVVGAVDQTVGERELLGSGEKLRSANSSCCKSRTIRERSAADGGAVALRVFPWSGPVPLFDPYRQGRSGDAASACSGEDGMEVGRQFVRQPRIRRAEQCCRQFGRDVAVG